jgi:hypothetical protein
VQRLPKVPAEPPAVPRSLTVPASLTVAGSLAESLPAPGGLWDHAVDDALRGEVGGTDALERGQLRGVLGVPVDDGAGALGRQGSEPGVLGGKHTVGGQQGQRGAAGSLPEQ